MVKKPRAPDYFTRILPPSEQAFGTFDQGSITEQKMIGFAGEGSAIHRLGPLYYWAWATAQRPASIEPHPHRGFEIMSYVLEGSLEHRDTLGHVSSVEAGGLQLMQTGAGIEHEEHFIKTPAQILQIWLDPHFRQQITVPPRYRAFSEAEFPRDGHARILLGPRSPVELVTPEVTMQDLQLPSGVGAEGELASQMGWAAIVLKGEGELQIDGQSLFIHARDFLVHQAARDTTWRLSSLRELRVIWIRVPLVLPYALFPKPRH